MRKIISISALTLLLVYSCNSDKNHQKDKGSSEISQKENVHFELIDREFSGVNFLNSLEQTEEENVFDDIYYFNGGGVAVGDINNDGLQDLYFGGNQTSNKLYLNKGDFKFEDITEKSNTGSKGWTTGVAMADVNNDGWLDIYACRTSPYVEDDERRNLLFINNQDGTFTERAAEFGLDNKGFSTQASFFDADNDGDLDMYLANRPLQYEGIYREFYKKYRFTDELGTHRMFINNNNKFTDKSTEADVLCNGYGLSANIGDLNQDGLTDIYVCNDFIYPDFIYYNKGNGKFVDKAKDMMKHTSLSSMGSDLADFNNDGLVDIFTVDMLAESNDRKKMNSNEDDYDKYLRVFKNGYGHQLMRNNLQLNVGNKTFVDIGFMAGVAETDWSWAPLFADFDNDGYKDLFVSNGYFKDFNNMDFIKFRNESTGSNDGKKESILSVIAIMPETKIQNYIFKNNGDLTFTKKSDEWGITQKTFSQGAVYADIDNDGDLDIVMNNLGEFPSLYKNGLDNKNYLRLKFIGNQSNSYGIGCKAWATIGGETQYFENYPTRGFQSTVEQFVHIGTGEAKKVDKLVIWWPSGKTQTMMDVKPSQLLVVKESDADFNDFKFPSSEVSVKKFISEMKPPFIFEHKESEFVDFRNEPLLPHMMSRFGPGVAVGDINGDGLDDVFIGGGARIALSKLFVQQKDGSFNLAIAQPWSKDVKTEHVDAQFFDMDGDGDLDLITVSGGNEFKNTGTYYSPMIYENDGKGYFATSIDALPNIETPALSVEVADIDGDQDLDIFIGGAVVPGAYPLPTASYLLENDGTGKYKDVTTTWSKGLMLPGIINECEFADLNNDGLPDLIIAGYWKNVSVFMNTGNQFIDQTAALGLNESSGWWNALKVMDVDGDGDLDIIAGNEGMNNLMRVNPSKPSYILQGDMTRNNQIDAVCFYTIQGKQVPLHSYTEIIQQMPGLIQKRYPKVSMYANATMANLFSDQELTGSKSFKINNFKSGVFVNEGKRFVFKPFPMEAQLSNINDMLAEDVNQDGKMDLVLVGNSDAPRISLGRNDAFNGLILLNEGKANWKPVTFDESGFYVPNIAQRIASIKTSTSSIWMVANNSEKAQFFKKTK